MNIEVYGEVWREDEDKNKEEKAQTTKINVAVCASRLNKFQFQSIKYETREERLSLCHNKTRRIKNMRVAAWLSFAFLFDRILT